MPLTRYRGTSIPLKLDILETLLDGEWQHFDLGKSNTCRSLWKQGFLDRQVLVLEFEANRLVYAYRINEKGRAVIPNMHYALEPPANFYPSVIRVKTIESVES